jgi:hypothetical protein
MLGWFKRSWPYVAIVLFGIIVVEKPKFYTLECAQMERPSFELLTPSLLEHETGSDVLELQRDNLYAIYKVREGELCIWAEYKAE